MIVDLVSATQNEDWEKTRKLLYQHWILECPTQYSPKEDCPWEGPANDTSTQSSLFLPLTAAICADSNVSECELSPLNNEAGLSVESSKAGQICGHVFKTGELTYVCKDCATDPTCVMCHTCFHKSEHKNHKYKMHPSSGSGYCDCGDPDAWRSHYACNDHAPSSSNEITVPHFLDNQERRVRNIFSIVLQYCNCLVCWKDEERLPLFLRRVKLGQSVSNVSSFMTVLYNDETHTYESVIRALELYIHCNKEQAMLIATIVDREGRSAVKIGTKAECDAVKQNIQRKTSKDSSAARSRTEKNGPLDVKVMECALVAHQMHAITLMSWINQQLEICPLLGGLIGNILLTVPALDVSVTDCDMDVSDSSTNESLALRFIRFDKSMWKAARGNLHQILMKTVLMNSDQKYEFSKLFLKNYEEMYEDFVDDDHDVDVSIVSLSVQFLTVPGIARRLIAEENALENIFCTLRKHTDKYLKEVEGSGSKMFDFQSKSFPAALKRAMHMMRDQSYILNSVPTPEQWTDNMRVNFVAGFKALLNFLSIMQGMDGVKRLSMEHQVWELEWETAFNIQLRIQEVIGLFILWASSDKIVHRRAFKLCLEEMKKHPVTVKSVNGETHVYIELNGDRSCCSAFDVARGLVSIHQQVWRICAGLFAAPSEYLNYLVQENNTYPDGPESNDEERDVYNLVRDFNQDLYENCLRVIVLCAQQAAQLWRRNGFSLINQIHNYFSPLCRTEMFDRDILLIQAGCSLTPPKDFVLHVIQRFNLVNWADFDFDPLMKQTQPFGKLEAEETSKVNCSLAEDLFLLFIAVCGERFRPGVGKCDLRGHIRREVIHILCMGPHPFSQIVKKMPNDGQLEKISLQNIVNEVADFKKPASTAAGQFHLKEEFLAEYNPFFYHYSKSDTSQAELYQQRIRAKLNKNLIACPPPIPCEFEPFFEPIINILKSDPLVKLCKLVLERTAKRSRFSSDRLLHRALYLIGMALNEQSRDVVGFDYVEAADRMQILKHMENLVDSKEVSNQANLLNWTISKYKEVASLSQHKDNETLKSEKEEGNKQDSLSSQREKAKATAAKMRNIALQKMAKMQKNFMESMETSPQVSGGKTAVEESVNNRLDEDEDHAIVTANEAFPVCIGPQRTQIDKVEPRKITCMLCQEDEVLDENQKKPFVCAAFVQKSLLFAQKDIQEPSNKYLRGGEFVPAGLHVGTDASTCSHTMHYECFLGLSDNLLSRERQRPRQQMMYNQKMVDPEVGEYLCPLCKRLSNCAMPIIPALHLLKVKGFSSARPETADTDFDSWFAGIRDMLDKSNQNRVPPAQPKHKTHNRKRSHSERSLLDLARQGDHMNTPIENSLTNSTHNASTRSLHLSNSNLRAASRSQSSTCQDTPSESSHELNDYDRQLMQELEALISFDQDAIGSTPNILEQVRQAHGVPPQDDAKRNTERRDGNKNFCDSVISILKGMPGITSILKSNKIVGPTFDLSMDMMKVFAKSLIKIRERRSTEDRGKESFEENMRGYLAGMATWHSTAHILRSTSAQLKIEGKPLFGALNTRQRDCIIAMSRLCSALSFAMQHVPEHVVLALRTLLSPPPTSTPNCPTSPITPECFSISPVHTFATSPSSSTSPSEPTTPAKLFNHPFVQFIFSTHTKLTSHLAAVNLLHIDMLSLAISLCMCIGWTWNDGIQSVRHPKKEREMLPDGSIDELYCVRLCLIGHLFQVIASFDDADMTEASDVDPAKVERMEKLWMIARPHDSPLVDHRALIQKLKESTICFLRPLALLYQSITMVPPPEALKDPSVAQYEPLCRFMGLPPNLLELISGPVVENLFEMWSSAIPSPMDDVKLVKYPIHPNVLIDLPEDFSDVIQMATAFRCPSVPYDETATNVPTLCLVCGEILCSQSYCCQKTINGKEAVGACRFHMIKCSGTMGIFLRIRDCSVVLMTSRTRGCFRHAPYVDEFGETDQGFRRGNPLKLSVPLYNKLRHLWLCQGISEEVVNQYEIDHRNVQYEWAHF